MCLLQVPAIAGSKRLPEGAGGGVGKAPKTGPHSTPAATTLGADPQAQAQDAPYDLGDLDGAAVSLGDGGCFYIRVRSHLLRTPSPCPSEPGEGARAEQGGKQLGRNPWEKYAPDARCSSASLKDSCEADWATQVMQSFVALGCGICAILDCNPAILEMRRCITGCGVRCRLR